MITLTWDELEQHEDDLKEYIKERREEDKLRQLAEDLCQKDNEWHLEHKRLGFYDPIAEVIEALDWRATE